MFEWDQFKPADAANTFWDVIVVGTGMGGSTIGHALAKRGLKVLFVEHGLPATTFTHPSFRQRLKGLFDPEQKRASRTAMGRWPHKISVLEGNRAVHFYPPLGFGPGGSTVVYGAALERLRRTDLNQSKCEHDGPGSLPDDWPINFDDLAKYYAKAEEHYHVCGGNDPLDPDDNAALKSGPPLSKKDQYFFDSFERFGLDPYRLHVGIAYKPGCVECLGVACPRSCKADASNRALMPALKLYGAKILLGCLVERLEVAGAEAKSVIANIDGQTAKLRSRIVVLAAGAFFTPMLLQTSKSPQWPNGVGNQTDMVGRGLMFHISDLFTLESHIPLDSAGPMKTLSSRAFYGDERDKLGSFQSVGVRISQGHIYSFLKDRLEEKFGFHIPLSGLVLRAVSIFSAYFFSNATVFATIQEDLPYRDNRVVTDPESPSGFHIEYKKSSELKRRITSMRRALKEKLKPLKPFFLSGNNNINWGHACGTCRFGTDPKSSVLGPDNKVWGTDNLYVVDASFFPSSGATNPSLTIAANALRVADIIVERPEMGLRHSSA